MFSTPNFSFYKNPRFSVNHLSEYLTTKNASQRENVIRKAKFPRKIEIMAYQQVIPHFQKFLCGNTHDLSYFDILLSKLEANSRRETGWPSDEAKRCINAVNAFKVSFKSKRMSKYDFLKRQRYISNRIEGVKINVRLDASVVENVPDGSQYIGGCTMLLTSQSKNIEERRKLIAAIIHWILMENHQTNEEPIKRLCMSFDVLDGQLTKAPLATTMLHKAVRASCREIKNNWLDVEPPNNYDGPNWH